jgi:hypothetical protein
VNENRFRQWLSEQSTQRVADEIANIRKNANQEGIPPRSRAAWMKMLVTAQAVLKIKEAKDAERGSR